MVNGQRGGMVLFDFEHDGMIVGSEAGEQTQDRIRTVDPNCTLTEPGSTSNITAALVSYEAIQAFRIDADGIVTAEGNITKRGIWVSQNNPI